MGREGGRVWGWREGVGREGGFCFALYIPMVSCPSVPALTVNVRLYLDTSSDSGRYLACAFGGVGLFGVVVFLLPRPPSEDVETSSRRHTISEHGINRHRVVT